MAVAGERAIADTTNPFRIPTQDSAHVPGLIERLPNQSRVSGLTLL